MQVLTPSGYVDIVDLNIGDEVIAYDINTGEVILNQLEGKTLWTPDMYPPDEIPGHYETITVSYEEPETQYVWVEITVIDDNGNEAKEWVQEEQIVMVTKYKEEQIWIPPVVIQTSYEVFQSINGDWKMYKINDTWSLFKDQSVWANMRVVHASDLQIGDIVYNDTDGDVVITSIEEVDVPKEWWRLDVSGDSSYIADGITLHNASRYWVGGGSSSNWSATGNTNWGSISGTQDNASVPTSADAVTFDGAGAAGNTNSTISATITILSLSITSAYTATMTHNAVLQVNGSITFGANYTIAGTSNLTMGGSSGTITSNGKTWPNGFTFYQGAGGTITLVGNFTIGGIMYVGNYNGSPSIAINKTTTEKLIVNGGLAATLGNGPNYFSGTAQLDFYGSTWSGVQVSTPMTNFGTVAISGTNAGYGGSAFLNSGTINAGTSLFNLGTVASFNSNGAIWNNIQIGFGNVTLTSDLIVNGSFQAYGASSINKTVNEVVYVYGGLTALYQNSVFGGTATVILKGGTWTTTQTNTPYQMPITIDGNVTISGTSLIYSGSNALRYTSGTVTVTGSTITLGGTPTLYLGGMTLNNVILNGGTTTLGENLNVGGTFSLGSASNINKTTSEKLILGGGLTMAFTLGGTGIVELTGGTWSGGSTLSTNLNIAGNVTISGNVYYGTNTITYVSGTPVVTGSTLILTSANTLNTSGMAWNNVTFSGTFTTTLTSDLVINGLWSTGGGVQTPTINATTTQTVTCNGGIYFHGSCSPIGTAKHIAKGGTLNTGASSNYDFFRLPLDIDGNVTFGAVWTFGSNTMTYVSGNVSTYGNMLGLCGTGTTLNVSGILFNNVVCNYFSGGTTVTLTSDLNIGGLLTSERGPFFNKTNSEKVNLYGGIYISNNGLSGTAEFVAKGGVINNSLSNVSISTPFTFDGNVTFSGGYYNADGNAASTLKYLSGNVNFKNTILKILNSIPIVGFNRCPVEKVLITSAKTVTMDQFFTGTPSNPCSVTCATAGSTYNVTFNDDFEKIGTNVIVSGCVLTRPQQLVLSIPFKINSLATSNRGIRYFNQIADGVPKNTPVVPGLSTGPAMSLMSDPCFTKQN